MGRELGEACGLCSTLFDNEMHKLKYKGLMLANFVHVPESHLQPSESGVSIHDTLDDITTAAVRSGRIQQLVDQALGETVRASSASQALSGLLAAGGGKAVQYLGSKVAKAVRGTFQASGLTSKRPF
eukprot:1143860-Pelagomonas_calceolata.AAC.2